MEQAGLERAADLRARKSTGLYWLERLVRFALFGLALAIYFEPLESRFPVLEKYELIAVCLLAGVWAYFDNRVMYRYGRKKRIEEVVAEGEAREAAERSAGPH